MKKINRPIENSYWVKPGQLLAGEYPRNPDDASSRLKLRHLLEAGVTSFLDLTEAGEYNLKPYLPLAQAEATPFERTITHQRMAIPDFGVTSPASMTAIQRFIKAQLDAGQVLYIHCYGGIGRTGTTVGCYLVEQGFSGADAIAQIAGWRAGTPDAHRLSPETDAQRQMIMNWQITTPDPDSNNLKTG